MVTYAGNMVDELTTTVSPTNISLARFPLSLAKKHKLISENETWTYSNGDYNTPGAQLPLTATILQSNARLQTGSPGKMPAVGG